MWETFKHDLRNSLSIENLYSVLYAVTELQEVRVTMLSEGLTPPIMDRPLVNLVNPVAKVCSVERSKIYSPANADAICPRSRHSKKRIFFIFFVQSNKCSNFKLSYVIQK